MGASDGVLYGNNEKKKQQWLYGDIERVPDTGRDTIWNFRLSDLTSYVNPSRPRPPYIVHIRERVL